MNQPSGWTEADFERWFLREPFLPDGERVLVVSKQRSLRHVIDLLALDANGGLVLIEVKNEKSTRAVIGQSLEYLAQHADTTVEDLEDDYARLNATSSLKADFRKEFNRIPRLTRRRRVYLVAPSFDFHTAACVRYLSDRLLAHEVEYRLIRTWPQDDGFTIEHYECPPPMHSRDIRSGFGMTPGGRLFYVLESGQQPVMWYVGKRRGDDALRPASRGALTQRSVQVVGRMLVPAKVAEGVDVSQSGTAWKHRKKPGVSAKLLGKVVTGDPESGQEGFAVLARFVNGEFARFERKTWGKFAAGWQRVKAELPDWRSLVAAHPGRL